MARPFANLGRNDQAFEWLKKRLYATRANGTPLINVLPLIDPLRKDPKFEEFLIRMKLSLDFTIAEAEASCVQCRLKPALHIER